ALAISTVFSIPIEEFLDEYKIYLQRESLAYPWKVGTPNDVFVRLDDPSLLEIQTEKALVRYIDDISMEDKNHATIDVEHFLNEGYPIKACSLTFPFVQSYDLGEIRLKKRESCEEKIIEKMFRIDPSLLSGESSQWHTLPIHIPNVSECSISCTRSSDCVGALLSCPATIEDEGYEVEEVNCILLGMRIVMMEGEKLSKIRSEFDQHKENERLRTRIVGNCLTQSLLSKLRETELFATIFDSSVQLSAKSNGNPQLISGSSSNGSFPIRHFSVKFEKFIYVTKVCIVYSKPWWLKNPILPEDIDFTFHEKNGSSSCIRAHAPEFIKDAVIFDVNVTDTCGCDVNFVTSYSGHDWAQVSNIQFIEGTLAEFIEHLEAVREVREVETLMGLEIQQDDIWGDKDSF
ncbi:hypothetical protein ADUPG1_009587, partial [Aduncisulcus paluster]